MCAVSCFVVKAVVIFVKQEPQCVFAFRRFYLSPSLASRKISVSNQEIIPSGRIAHMREVVGSSPTAPFQTVKVPALIDLPVALLG